MKAVVLHGYGELDVLQLVDVVDPVAYLDALSTYRPGDVVIIFTPDDTHHDIAMAAVTRGMHVMVTNAPRSRSTARPCSPCCT